MPSGLQADGQEEITVDHMRTYRHKVVSITAALILGYASWVLPVVLIPGPVEDEIPIMIHFSTDPDIANFFTLLSLAVSGILLGLLSQSNYKRSTLLGSATGLPIVVLSFVEVFLGLASHSLLGIELFMYALFTIPAVLGALLGTFLKIHFGRKEKWG